MNAPDRYRALHEAAGSFRRDDRGRLLLTGTDRRLYLHGLLTNDIASLGPGTGCYAALLTPQGRMMADMRVFETGDAVLMDLEATTAPAIQEHLDRFVIAEDVRVEDVTGRLGQIGVYGPLAAAAVSAAIRESGAADEAVSDPPLLNALPLFANLRWDAGGEIAHLIRSDDIGVAGFDLVLPQARVSGFLAALGRAGVVAVDAEVVERTRIEAGIPRFLVDMDTTTIPLEAGIEDRAISMTKGCYVGQEVVIRVLHRGGGRVARKLVRLRATDRIARDDRIVSGEREVGRVTSAAASPRFGGFAGLGYVARDFSAPGTELTVGAGGARAIIPNP